jgi:D-beta-D-heptose 7-phosphate kinase/D-beta-D-heptose 1-phosphate adenosyltransferase
MHQLLQKLDSFRPVKVALVGDFLLDRYVYGDVERINQEAPVPILQIVRSQSLVGGAGNVAAAVPALGSHVVCLGVVGNDAGGDELCKLLADAGADASRLLHLADRPTSIKTRFVGLAQHRSAQQMLRVDDENASPLDSSVQGLLLKAAGEAFAACDVVVLEDYNKGVLGDANTPALIAAAGCAGKAVMVDPAMLGDYSRYVGCTVIKPNRYEAQLASGIKITDDASLEAAARQIIKVAKCQAVVISLDKEGMFLCQAGGMAKRIPHRRPRSVYDVTGAGDQTLAVLAVALAQGWDYQQAVELSNVGGGLEVERFGFVPITHQEMRVELEAMMGLRSRKVLDRTTLAGELSRRRNQGQRIVFTNGCFDLLHMGHVRYIRQAREMGDCLIVAINSDASVSRLKGPARPVIAQQERAEMLAALECVDYVTIFDEDTPIPLLEILRPDILAKGGTTPVVVGRELVEGYGGRVLTLDKVEGLSTTQIIDRIVAGRQ